MRYGFNGYNLNITKVQLVGIDKNHSGSFIYIGSCSATDYLGASSDYDSLITHFKGTVEEGDEEVTDDDENCWVEYPQE